MFRVIISILTVSSFVFGDDLANMAMPQLGGPTLPPPFGVPPYNSFQGGVPPQNGMNPMMQQQQPGFPQMNPPPPMFNNQGPQMGQLGGFTNGFADMLGMSPPPMRGFPGSPPETFNLIDSATSPPVIVKKRQAFPQNGINGQPGSSSGQSNSFGHQPGAMGQQQQRQMNGGQQPLGPAGIPIVGNVQGSFQNPSNSQPFGSFQNGLGGGNSMQQPQQQQPGMNQG